MNKWYTYIIQCSDVRRSLYTGITNNLAKRFLAHNSGKGAKFTRGRGPLTIIGVFHCNSKSDALKLEFKIKKLSRAEKFGLCDEASVSTKSNSS